MRPTRSCATGFSLIELMAVVAIVAILCAVAYPGYVQHVGRAKRAQARSVLLESAQFMERYYSTSGSYLNASLPARLGASPPGASAGSADFTITATVSSDGGAYTLTAAPQYTESCGNLTLNHTGARDRSGTGLSAQDCWR